MDKNISKVLLINPPRTVRKGTVKRCPTPLGLAYIAAVLEKERIDVEILDAAAEGYDTEIAQGDHVTFGLAFDEVERRIRESAPDLVGVTCPFSSEMSKVHKICGICKKISKDIAVVVGGLHPSMYPGEVMKNEDIDFVIIGEGEYRLLNLIGALNGEGDLSSIDGLVYRDGESVKVNPGTRYIEDLDNLPFPARHLLPMEKYLRINVHLSPYPRGKRTEQILTSRGCPFHCVFCASHRYWGHKFRARTPENVLGEMRSLVEKYGIEEFQFADDNLTIDQKRAIRIFELMRDSLKGIVWAAANGIMVNTLTTEMLHVMKESGCYQLTFAVESGNEHVLRRIIRKPVNLEKVPELVKEAKNLGISLHATFVVGLPGETFEQVNDTFRFARKMDFDSVSFFIASPIPGSELYDICKEKGYLREDFDPEMLDFKTPAIKLPYIGVEELEKMIEEENFRYITRYILRHPLRALRKYATFIRGRPSQILKILGRVT